MSIEDIKHTLARNAARFTGSKARMMYLYFIGSKVQVHRYVHKQTHSCGIEGCPANK